MKKITIKALFFLFVLVLFSSCSKNIEKCTIKPRITVEMQKENESSAEKLKIDKREAYFTCSF
jgi:uncharacterized lipoprotein YajG